MIREIRGYAMLEGVRSGNPQAAGEALRYDISAAAKHIEETGRLPAD